MSVSSQLFIVNEPVPSLRVNSVYYKDGIWLYGYAFETPCLLSDERRDTPLYLGGFLTNMIIKDSINKNMVNVEIYSKEDIYNLIDIQRDADNLFRKKFYSQHQDIMDTLTEETFTLADKSQVISGRYIVRLKEDNGVLSTFVGRA